MSEIPTVEAEKSSGDKNRRCSYDESGGPLHEYASKYKQYKRGKSAEPRLVRETEISDDVQTDTASCSVGTYLVIPCQGQTLKNCTPDEKKNPSYVFSHSQKKISLDEIPPSLLLSHDSSSETPTDVQTSATSDVSCQIDYSKFQVLESLLEHSLNPEASDGSTTSQHTPSAGQIAEDSCSSAADVGLIPQRCVLSSDSPTSEHLFHVCEEHVAQQRMVSVEREQCKTREQATMSAVKLLDTPSRHHHRAVTVSRSQTWSFRDRSKSEQFLRKTENLKTQEDKPDGSSNQLLDETSVDDLGFTANRCFSPSGSKTLPSKGSCRTVMLLPHSAEELPVSSAVQSCLLRDYDKDKDWSFVPWTDEPRSQNSTRGRGRDREKDAEELLDHNETMTSPDSSHPDATDGTEHQQLTQRQVIVQRDERGYGFTVEGDKPVYIQTVKPNGAAARAGVHCGDRIIKVNGTLVTNCDHVHVVKMIKSGSCVRLTLQSESPAGVGVTSSHLAESHPSDTSTPSANPVLDRDRISAPQAVDQLRGERLTDQKVTTLRMMRKQMRDDCEKMKAEYQRNPTEHARARLDDKLQTLRRVENELIHADTKKVAHSDGEGSETPGSSPLFSLPPTGPKHRRTGSMPDTLFKINGHRSRDHVSPNLTDDVRDVLREEPEMRTSTVSDHQKPTSASKTAWPEASLPPGETGMKTSSTVTSSNHEPQLPAARRHKDVVNVGSQRQVNVISMEDDEFSTDEEHVDEPGIFNDISHLKNRPAHTAVFLHYLLSNADPSPLLFYLVTETYPLGSGKEMRKWAYEIHSTFLCDKSPLRMLVNDAVMSSIDSILQQNHDRDDTMKTLFNDARNTAQDEIADLLSDFRHKRSIGLGSIYGDNELHDIMDRQSELKIVDKALWKHFEQLIQDEDSDRSQALASALATFFRHVGYHGFKNSPALDRCPYFNAKDRKLFKFTKVPKKAVHEALSHQFTDQQYFNTTLCHCCRSVIWGIGSQGYQCSSCKMNVHKNCLERVHDPCSPAGSSPVSGGTLRKKSKPSKQSSTLIHKIISRKPSTSSSASTNKAEGLHEEMRSPSATSVAVLPPEVQEQDEESERLRRSKRECAGVPRAQSMSSVYDMSQRSKAKPPVRKQTAELSAEVVPSRVGKLVARYSEIGKTLVSPFDVTPGVGSRGHSPVQEVVCEEKEYKDKPTVTVVRSESLNEKAEPRTNVRRAHSDVRDDETARQAVASFASTSSSSLSVSGESAASNSNDGLSDAPLTHRSSFSQPTPPTAAPDKSVHLRVIDDPDFDTEVELPPLEAVIPKELLRKLKPKEKKRQEVINELFYTEKAHVRVVKVLQRIFYQPMRDETWIPANVVSLLFPNIDELVELHSVISDEFAKKREESPVVGDFAEILVNRFSSGDGERFTQALSKFCCNQSHALETLRVRQRKDQKFANFLQDAASHPYCRRLELKDFIPMTMQRLTKYPLLIESLKKYTPPNSNEYELLTHAHDCSKNILNEVNHAVQECENHQRLVEIQRRLDRRPIENSSNIAVAEFKKLDLTEHQMLYEGPLTWRISRTKQIDLHGVLLENILVLLQKQDDRLVLRCQSMTVVAGKEDTKYTHSPIIKLSNKLLTRSVATDKRAFFLVSNSDVGAQIYELVANSEDEKNKWFKHITDAAEACKVKDGGRNRKQSSVSQTSTGGPVLDTSSSDVTSPVTPSFLVESLDTVSQGVEVLHVEPSTLVQPNEVVVSSTVCMEKTKPVLSPYELLNQKTEEIERAMNEKKALVANILQIPLNDNDTVAEVVSEVKDSSDARELLLGAILQADALTCVINQRINAEHVHQQPQDTTASSQHPVGGLPVSVSGVQLLSISTQLHHNLSRLTELVVEKLQDNERLKNELKEMRSRLDTAAVTSTVTGESEEQRSQSVAQEADVVSEQQTDVSVTDTPTTTDIVTDAVTDSVVVTCEPVIVEPLEVVEAMPEPAVVDAIDSVSVSVTVTSEQASDL